MAKNSKKGNKKGVTAVGLALAAAGAAAGYYFYASENAAKNRKIAAKWATDMKRDVIAQAKKLKNIDRKQLTKIVDQAAGVYASAKSIDKDALRKAARELKDNWQDLAQNIAPARSKSTRRAKTAKKTTKKSA